MSQAQQEELTMAERYGFTPTGDTSRGPGWHFFKRGDWEVWTCRLGWARAKIVDGRYRYHTYHEHMETALKTCPAAK